MAKNSCYVVFEGRNPGVYDTWPDCNDQVCGYSNAKFKGYIAKSIAKSDYRKYCRRNNMPVNTRNF